MKVFTESDEFVHACITSATVETTGIKGGNHSHGGFAKLTIKDVASTAIEVTLDGQTFYDISEVSVSLRGDAEIRNFHSILIYAAHALDNLLRQSESDG